MTSGMAEDIFPRETTIIGENYLKKKFKASEYCSKHIQVKKNVLKEKGKSTKHWQKYQEVVAFELQHCSNHVSSM